MQQKSFIMLFFPRTLPLPPSSLNLKTDGAKNLWGSADPIYWGVQFAAEQWGPQGSFKYVIYVINCSKEC